MVEAAGAVGLAEGVALAVEEHEARDLLDVVVQHLREPLVLVVHAQPRHAQPVLLGLLQR